MTAGRVDVQHQQGPGETRSPSSKAIMAPDRISDAKTQLHLEEYEYQRDLWVQDTTESRRVACCECCLPLSSDSPSVSSRRDRNSRGGGSCIWGFSVETKPGADPIVGPRWLPLVDVTKKASTLGCKQHTAEPKFAKKSPWIRSVRPNLSGRLSRVGPRSHVQRKLISQPYKKPMVPTASFHYFTRFLPQKSFRTHH
jgi:hypothetical protein